MAATSKKDRDAAYYRDHAEEIKEREREKYAALTPSERTTRSRRLIAAQDPEVRRQRKRDEQAQLKEDVIGGYGGRCACCGTEYMPHLSIDHIHGGGREHRRKENQRSLYRRLRREGFPGGFQVLCFNCNFAKHVLGECGCQGANLTLVEGVG